MAPKRRGSSANSPQSPPSTPGSRPGRRGIGPEKPMSKRPLGRSVGGADIGSAGGPNPKPVSSGKITRKPKRGADNVPGWQYLATPDPAKMKKLLARLAAGEPGPLTPSVDGAQIDPGSGGGGMGGTKVPNPFGQQPKGPQGKAKNKPKGGRTPEGFLTFEQLGGLNNSLQQLVIENRTVVDKVTGQNKAVPFLVFAQPMPDADGVVRNMSFPIVAELFAKRDKSTVTHSGSETLTDNIYIEDAPSEYLVVDPATNTSYTIDTSVSEDGVMQAALNKVTGNAKLESNAYNPEPVSSYIMENQSAVEWTFDKDQGGIPVFSDVVVQPVDTNQVGRAATAIKDFITTSPEGFDGITDAEAFVKSVEFQSRHARRDHAISHRRPKQ